MRSKLVYVSVQCMNTFVVNLIARWLRPDGLVVVGYHVFGYANVVVYLNLSRFSAWS